MAKPKQQWYQRIGMKPLMSVIAVGLFSIIGALYLGASHAATAFIFQPSADYTLMTPHATVGLKLPYTVKESLNLNDSLVKNGQTVYQLPVSTSTVSYTGTSVTTSFNVHTDSPTVATQFGGVSVCAVVRRNPPAAPSENLTINITATNANYNLSSSRAYPLTGSYYYQWVCSNTLRLQSGKSWDALHVTAQVVNHAAAHTVRVAQIKLYFWSGT
jgi:hypothetical protein